MPVYSFNRALVRTPGASVVDGLKSDALAVPDHAAILRAHAAYVAALSEAGLAVEVLPALEAFPDSVFVEDPALVFSGLAILLNLGAPSRAGEAAALKPDLEGRFAVVRSLPAHAHADGGDILVTPDRVFIGLSARTDPAGAAALTHLLGEFGYQAATVRTPASALHLKSGCALLDDRILFATKDMAASGLFPGFRVLAAPHGEEAATNLLRLNETVVMPSGFPGSRAMIAAEGFSIVELDVTEIAKLDAGLSCMSLRWLDQSAS